MTIGIINAMHKEHEQIVSLLTKVQSVTSGVIPFVTGLLNDVHVVLAESGIGKVNAAVTAVELFHHYSPDALINTGVAGGIDEKLDVMDVVVGSRVVYHDVDCGPEAEIGQVQGLPLYYKGNEHLLHIARTLQTDTAIHEGLICSGDRFISDRESLNLIKKQYPDGLAVDMESGALAQTCHLYGIPFLSFRIISDTPGAKAHFDQYQNFWGEMAERSFRVTQAFLLRLTRELTTITR